jgi:hypothetical protein
LMDAIEKQLKAASLKRQG